MIEEQDFEAAHSYLLENFPGEGITDIDGLCETLIQNGFDAEATKEELTRFFLDCIKDGRAETPENAAKMTNALVSGMIFAVTAERFARERVEQELSDVPFLRENP